MGDASCDLPPLRVSETGHVTVVQAARPAAASGADPGRVAHRQSLGPVDILVANVGASLTPPAPLEDIPEDGWRATVDANLLRGGRSG
jgi:NAD(P)-dependent dehydrogenase (short-subunit alcohol dehydrogenase family)